MRALIFVTSLALAACNTIQSCPTTIPADGSTCHERAFVCEEGGGDHQRCSTISTCSDAIDSSWSNQSDAMCTMTNAAACGATYESTTVGGTCPTSGVSCDFPEGRCSCSPCASSTSSGLAWACRAWTDGIDPACPSDREPIGSPCTTPNLVCRYQNTCTVSFGPDVECLNERWQPLTGAPIQCGVPTCGV